MTAAKPVIVVAGTSSGVGKTTLAVGLMAALRYAAGERAGRRCRPAAGSSQVPELPAPRRIGTGGDPELPRPWRRSHGAHARHSQSCC